MPSRFCARTNSPRSIYSPMPRSIPLLSLCALLAASCANDPNAGNHWYSALNPVNSNEDPIMASYRRMDENLNRKNVAEQSSYGATLIESSSPARIEIDNQDFGITPIRANINVAPYKSMLITAVPVAGGPIQTKYLNGQNPTPTHIYFDMDITRKPVEVDVNLQSPAPTGPR